MSFAAAKRWLLASILSTVTPLSLAAQSAKPPLNPIELFHRVSARLIDDWRRMPRYTCTQDITRRFYWSDLKGPQSCSVILQKRSQRKRALPLGSTDHLELEVALADRREVHSWPGATSIFEDEEIRNLVGNGALGSGDFAGFVGAIFGGSAKVTYEGESVVNGKTLLEYSFQVSKSASRYQVDTAGGPIVTAYKGSFLLDPQAEDLVRLTVSTAELPVATSSCQAINEIEYGRSEIHGIPVLIPRETDLRLIRTTGDEAATSTSYSSCRQFASKSRLLLDPPSTEGRKGAQPVGQMPASAFPAGIKFKCRILTEIDSEMPAGRPVEGVLRSPIRDKNRAVLAPTGARVRGRIIRLAQHFSTYDYFELALRLGSVEVDGTDRPIYAILTDQPAAPMPPKAQVGYDPSDYPQAMSSSVALLANTGEFFFVQEHMRLKKLDAEWVTTSSLEKKKELKKETQLAGDQSGSKPVTTLPASAVAPAAQQEVTAESAPAQTAATAPIVTALQNDALKQPNSPPAADEQAPDFRLKVESNLVLVRVVVRDAKGSPIQNLKKDDFRLFDKGRQQEIAEFETVYSPAESSIAATVGNTGPPSQTRLLSAAHPSLLALYFDDLNTSDADMMQARDAAEHYLGASLPANEQVAIFTSSGMPTDFTSDRQQIRNALAKLHASPRALSRGHDCPELSDYQAEQINEFQDDYTIDAWKAALDEVAARCPPPPLPPGRPGSGSNVYPLIRHTARLVLDQAQILARSNLQRLEQVVNYASQFPGQRTIVLVSPGFLSESEQAQLDRIIDRALRLQVVVSSLDPKGLALLMRETDVTRSYAPTANSGALGATHNIDTMREAVATDVLAELADGTGGQFFHNNNDLQAGFQAVAGSPMYYILAFVPGELDGKFHKLEVKLTRSKGNIQARRGYFALKNVEVAANAQPAPKTASKDDLQRMMSSREEVHDLAIEMSTEVVPTSGQTQDLTIVVRLDMASVPFRKEGDRNVNTVTFVAGVYDSEGKWVNGEKKQFDLKLPDSELKDMQAHGVGVRNTFTLKPGRYLVREVVQDSEDHHIAALNRTIEVP